VAQEEVLLAVVFLQVVRVEVLHQMKVLMVLEVEAVREQTGIMRQDLLVVRGVLEVRHRRERTGLTQIIMVVVFHLLVLLEMVKIRHLSMLGQQDREVRREEQNTTTEQLVLGLTLVAVEVVEVVVEQEEMVDNQQREVVREVIRADMPQALGVRGNLSLHIRRLLLQP